MLRWQLCKAIEQAGGLLPANWMWLDSLPQECPAEMALVLGPGCGPLAELTTRLAGRPMRLLTHPLTSRQRCRNYPFELEVDGLDWLLLVGHAAGPNTWEQRPLYGQRIALTREPSQAQPLALRLEELGAEVVLCPVLQFVAPQDPRPLQLALEKLESYQWVIFTSPNGVRTFFAALRKHGDARRLGGAQLAVIGPGTAQALQDCGLTPDVQPQQSVAEGLLEALASHPMEGRRVLLARAQEAREVLPEGLRLRGAEVDVVACYRTVMPQPPPQLDPVDRVVLMSASAARHFRQLTSSDPECVCIGPVTAETARQLGFGHIIQARQFNQEGVIEALLGGGL